MSATASTQRRVLDLVVQSATVDLFQAYGVAAAPNSPLPIQRTTLPGGSISASIRFNSKPLRGVLYLCLPKQTLKRTTSSLPSVPDDRDWILGPFGIHSPGYGLTAVIMTQAYIWLPYVVLPIYAGMDRVPGSLLEAAGDLGAPSALTIRTVVLPLALPAVIAGTIFSFSLTMGDYITVNIVGGANQMLGNLVYTNVGAANNLPLAAAIALIPIVIMLGYLALVRRTGALDNL